MPRNNKDGVQMEEVKDLVTSGQVPSIESEYIPSGHNLNSMSPVMNNP
jgi:hypothetical protein